MSSKKVFNVNDKVFAKIRGHPPWPAIISGIKADTPTRQRYNVLFYGTGESGECKSEELFPYAENKSKLGKIKRKNFVEALSQIENDDNSPVPITPSNSSHIERLDHGVLERAIGQQKIKQSADRKVSFDIKQLETLNTTESVLETSDVILDSSKAVKSLSKIKTSPTSRNEIPFTNSVTVGQVSCSGRTINKTDLLLTEFNLLECGQKLRMALQIDHADYDGALESLETILGLQFNALMLKKHQEIVETIKPLRKYSGNAKEWNLNEKDTILHDKKSTLIRGKADAVFNKFISLFNVSEEEFEETFNKAVEDFSIKTKHLDIDQICALTSDENYS